MKTLKETFEHFHGRQVKLLNKSEIIYLMGVVREQTLKECIEAVAFIEDKNFIKALDLNSLDL